MLTQDRLKELLHYDADTGVFTRLTHAGRAAKGDIAGSNHSNGYLVITLEHKKYFGHRLAHLYVNGEFPPDQTDHADHNRANNKWSDISRCVTSAENSKNRLMSKSNKSGFCGVIWTVKQNKWTASLAVNKKNIYLGCFELKEDAISARKAANIKYGFHVNHGRTNYVQSGKL